MKIAIYLAEIVSEFSGFHHSPDFKPSRSTGDFHLKSGKSGKSSRRSSTESKQSLNIHVGVHDICTVSPNSRSYSESGRHHFN